MAASTVLVLSIYFAHQDGACKYKDGGQVVTVEIGD